MRVVVAALENMELLGIHPNQTLMNGRFWMAFIQISMHAVLNWAYLLIEAKTFWEITNAVFITSTTTMIAVIFPFIASKRPKMYAMLQNAEEMVNKSE